MACGVDGVPPDATPISEPYQGDCTEWSDSFNSSLPESVDGLRIELSTGQSPLPFRTRTRTYVLLVLYVL